MKIDQGHVLQPPALPSYMSTLTVVISGMALGGAQWIVLDWIRRIDQKWKVHLVLLRDREEEWPIPSWVTVTRLHHTGSFTETRSKLVQLGQSLAASQNPTCLVHLLSEREEAALREGGAFVVQVFHNARDGWCDQVESLDVTKPVIAVSHAARNDLVDDGWTGDVSVIHHLPCMRSFNDTIRAKARSIWRIPEDAYVIGMIGSVKPQKDYSHALRILRELHDRGENVYLVILGGVVGQKDPAEWKRTVAMVHELGVRNYVAMPGFVTDAVGFAPAFDLLLNTSHYEGLSVATLEVLASGMNMVASNVGGQGEVFHTGLFLVEKDASIKEWADVIQEARSAGQSVPLWARFPSYRLWTLAHLAHSFQPTDRVLFVTANLNSGGAQRSLVNLASGLNDKSKFEIVVAGASTTDAFYRQLFEAGVEVSRSQAEDAFGHAEVIVDHIVKKRIGTVCFWNTDSKLKLLLLKTLGYTDVMFVDVSPGKYAFESLENATQFGERICFSARQFYERLDHLVLKFEGERPESYRGPVSIIKNGVPRVQDVKQDYTLASALGPQIAVCGRIDPTKFLFEIVDAVQIVKERFPEAELHVYGAAEPLNAEHADELHDYARSTLGNRVVFHGPTFNAQDVLKTHDAFVVLGRHQGCPNALLEALSVGLPCVANNDGGTREQIVHGSTGLLIEGIEPGEVADALIRVLEDRTFASVLGRTGRGHVASEFSMEGMISAYQDLLWDSRVASSDEVVA